VDPPEETATLAEWASEQEPEPTDPETLADWAEVAGSSGTANADGAGRGRGRDPGANREGQVSLGDFGDESE
jgi:hypothetical protein